MIVIQDRIFVDILIDNKPLPQGFNSLSSIVMVEGNGLPFPQMRGIFNDFQGTLTNTLALTEANEIIITVGKSPQDVKTVSRQYRLFGMKQLPSAFGPQLKIVATYDAPAFITANVRESYEGSTSKVLKEVAGKCALTYSGPEEFNGKKLNDRQVWLNVCKNRSSFVFDIVRHGFIDAQSAVSATLTSLGELRYRNFMDCIEVPKEKIKYVFVHNIPPGNDDQGRSIYWVRQAKDRSTAGLTNNWVNYGSTRSTHTLSGTPDVEDTVDVNTSGGFLPINSQVKSTVQRSRVDASHFDCGNTHPKYERALYQNIKLLALFSERMSLLVYEPTDVQLYDTVIYKQADTKIEDPVKNTDIYIVIGKSIMVKAGKSYAERIEIARMSLTTKGETPLVTESGGSGQDQRASATSIPESLIDSSVSVARNTLSLVNEFTRAFQKSDSLVSGALSSLTGLTSAVRDSLYSLADISRSITTIVNNPSLAVGAVLKGLPALSGVNNALSQTIGLASSAVSSVQGAVNTVTGGALNGVGSSLGFSTLVNQSLYKAQGLGSLVSGSFGALSQVGQLNNVYNSVLGELQRNAYPLSKIPGGQDALNSFSGLVADQNVLRQQSNVCTANGWNTMVSGMYGVPIPAMTPSSYSDNTFQMSNLVAKSLSPVNDGLRKVYSVSDLSRSMLTSIKRLDSSGQQRWVNPEISYTPVRTVYATTATPEEKSLACMNEIRSIEDSNSQYQSQLQGAFNA